MIQLCVHLHSLTTNASLFLFPSHERKLIYRAFLTKHDTNFMKWSLHQNKRKYSYPEMLRFQNIDCWRNYFVKIFVYSFQTIWDNKIKCCFPRLFSGVDSGCLLLLLYPQLLCCFYINTYIRKVLLFIIFVFEKN